jgi:hypothetical protein
LTCAALRGRRKRKNRREFRDAEEFIMETAQGDG